MIAIGTRAAGVERCRVRTRLGDFEVRASARGVRAVFPVGGTGGGPVSDAPPRSGAAMGGAAGPLALAAEALHRYAEGGVAPFLGPLDVTGPDLHLAVWERLRAIPFGTTVTYGGIARSLGLPGEARAVGAAVAANPLCILVPCHRVVGADGSLRGFAWGLDLKRRLLAHEGRAPLPLIG